MENTSVRDVGEGWGANSERDGLEISDAFCLACQEALPIYSHETNRCPRCQRVFVANDPTTYRSQRLFHRVKFWFPGASAALVFGTLSTGIAYWKLGSWFAWLALLPVPLGLLSGYIDSYRAWCWSQMAVSCLFVLAVASASQTLWALPTGICAGVLTAAPVALGFAFGALLRSLLVESRWDQRWFL